MKFAINSKLLLFGLCAVFACAVFFQSNRSDSATRSNESQATKVDRSAHRVIHNHDNCALPRHTVTAKEIAQNGLLWEKADNTSLQTRVSIPVEAKVLADFSNWKKGDKLSLNLSDKMPALDGVVEHTGVQADGTVIAHFVIPGNPTGHLMLQENKDMDFFQGHIIYDDYPVAYSINKSGDSMDLSRKPIDGILCSFGDQVALNVQSGLPTFFEARGGNGGGGGGGKPGGGGGDGGGGGGGGPKGKQPSVSISGGSVNEGDTGSVQLNFSVSLNKSSTATITVDYATANGSASAGADYTANSGQLSFAAGETSKTISVAVLGDTEDENDETFSVNLSNQVNAKAGAMSATGTIIDNDTAPSNVPVLNSRPGATAVLYIDLDGEYVTNTYWNTYENGGQPINAPGVSDSYSQSKMSDIWQRVAEDYEPFDVNVTTDEAVYLSAPQNRRMRCIVTPYYQWFDQAGGVAYLDSFVWTGDTPCWVFSSLLGDSAKNIAEATSHEYGHTLGLYHDGRTSPQEGYYYGHGSGATGWAPIMGVGYNRSLVQWSKGEYANADNTEDDLAIITGQNGFGYRVDDHGNTTSSATTVAGSIASGVIELRTDVDVLAFNTAGGSGTISVTGAAPSSNLDVLLQVYDGSGQLVASSNPADQITASASVSMASGTYYVRISGVGKGNPLDTGYTDYGSLGAYTVTTDLP
ncbi:MAG: Calx-beta domain-containing protein [Akkermansiaceae bacterium]